MQNAPEAGADVYHAQTEASPVVWALATFTAAGDTCVNPSGRVQAANRAILCTIEIPTIGAMKNHPVHKIKAMKVPGFILVVSVIAVFASALHPFVLPGLQSYAEWAFHRTTSFEKRPISIPAGWSEGEEWHLLSLRKPHFFAYALTESTIVVDPFAERHPGQVEEAWQIRSHRWGRPIDAIPGARCAEAYFYAMGPGTSAIDCLSPDSTVVVEFKGTDGDLSAFRDIYRQASAITGLHPGQIAR